ncbi:glycine oxidase ThiO [Alkalihalophilus marmarensis]|jgi:glycine oxidase|uniref:glycine oxidase n=1 Tax=Alkalihalophilus marmarensis DSM 21297 TaxID=1188261 RepID=U6STA1_9BACI|nr:glycine oxidase ThiO [Alkalihalophilus marmarensis]ERN54833.1 glycine oxidase [Alkalihalophilus marmarensis DSM 21297]MCM3488548.1 glycine oxidase ThiO [Alkalihalophilus marmarensis]
MTHRVIVLGGGVIGLASALELSRKGHDVTVLEKVRCGGQASGAAAGMLAPYSEIGEDPDDFFRLCLASLREYPVWQEEVKNLSGHDFEYTNSGSLHAVYHEADLLALKTRQSWQREWGAEAELVDATRIKKLEPHLSDSIIGAMHYPEESHVFAPDYVGALEEACRKNGVTIVEELEAVEIHSWKEDIDLVSKNGQRFQAERLVIASGAWSKELEETFSLNLPVYPIRGQICAYELGDKQVNHIVYTSQGYLVPKANGTLVNGASEDIAGFKTDVTEKGIARLTNWNNNIFPFLTDLNPFHTWAGLRPATQDGYPFIGEHPSAKHIIFATGHYRNGILLSPITAKIVAALLSDEKTPVPIETFAPNRFTY